MTAQRRPLQVTREAVRIDVDAVTLDGDLRLPDRAGALVIFAHGSGSSRFSGRNRVVAAALEREGVGTLLLDLLTPVEASVDEQTRGHRFDIDLLARRVVGATRWMEGRADLRHLPLVLFGASTGAAAALIAAAGRPDLIRAVISRGGRPDLAEEALPNVQAPTLLVVGGRDEAVIQISRDAIGRMRAPVELVIIPGATHLFEEAGALDEVARLAVDWCRRHVNLRLISY